MVAFEKGTYVRLRVAPQTRMGTIEGHRMRNGKIEYLFLQDPRLNETGPVFEVYFLEEELEEYSPQ